MNRQRLVRGIWPGILLVSSAGGGFSQSARPVDTLLGAASSGKVESVRAAIAAGAPVNAVTSTGKTALIVAAQDGRLEVGRVLINAGADLNLSDRGLGTALEAAERAGHSDFAAMLRQAGARTSGRSVGDTVCVRPWKGEGYCGTVDAISKGAYRIRVSEVVGCREGCVARTDCSDGKPVGGEKGIRLGDTVSVEASCLTHTGVRP